MINESSNATEELFGALVGFGRALRSLSQAGSAAGDMARADVAALAVIAECGSCRPSALAGHTGVGPSMVSRQLAHLQDAGLVERVVDPDDRRAGIVSLTDAGRARLEASKASYVDRLGARLQGWDPDRIADATALLRELSDLLAERPTVAPATTTSDRTALPETALIEDRS